MIRFILIAPALLLATACANEPLETLDPDFGAAVRHNMAVHILPIEPVGQIPEPIPTPGPRANLGMDRYMKGQVLAPRDPGGAGSGS